MREIKFRAWNGFQMFLGLSIIETASVIKSQDVQLMQYTGLKDKNGVEIYEGDIVYSHISKDTLVIKWGVLTYGLVFDVINLEFYRDMPFRILAENPGALEIIGNKFQNPELLEVNNES